MGKPFLVQQSASVTPGQTATCRVDGETFLGPDVKPDLSRRLPTDATGRYLLHSDSSDTNPPLSLQVNQAGWALVGWIAATAPFVSPKADIPGGQPISAVLVADLDPGAVEALPSTPEVSGQKSGSRLVYKDVGEIERHDPNEVLDPEKPFLRADPLKAPQPAVGWPDLMDGWIAFEVIAPAESDHWDEVVPRLRATVILTRRSGADTTLQTLVFDMVDPEARVSERAIAEQDPLLQGYLIANNRKLIPPSFFDTTSPSGAKWKAAVDLFASGGVLETQITAYWKVADEATIDHRQPIIGAIRTALANAIDWQDGSEMAALLNAKLLRVADRTVPIQDFGNSSWATQLFSHVGMQLPISQWLSAIAACEKQKVDLSSSPNAAPAPGAVASLLVVPNEFLWLSNGKSFGSYRYTFKFGSVGPADLAALKKEISRLPKWAQKLVPSVPSAKATVAKGVQFMIAVFKLTISAESSRQVAVGPMARDNYSTLWGERTFYGVTYEVSAGLGSIPGLPDHMQIDSPFMVNADAFADALFEVKGGGAQAGVSVPGVKGTTVGVSVRRMTFNLPDGTVLEGDLPEGNLVPDPVFGLSSSDPKKVAKLAKARSKKEFFEKVWSLGAGVEAMAGRLVFGHPSPEHWVHPPQERTADGGDGRTVASFFKLDSADINTALCGWSRRFLLESLLAVDLYLFNGAPAFSVIGHASPEGTHRHNLILSQLRAAAVRQAILDAIVLDPDFIVADGDGDELAKRTPVDANLDPLDPKNKDAKTFDEADPDGDTKKRDIFKTAHTEQSDQWPKFRKVVIYWWGQFFAKIETTGSLSDQDANQPPPTDPTQPQEAPPDQSNTTPVA